MENVNKTINNWLDELDNFKYPSYESLPDIDLYMEQLIMYLDRELKVFKTSSLDKVITALLLVKVFSKDLTTFFKASSSKLGWTINMISYLVIPLHLLLD